MPFRKVGDDNYVSPSGRHFNGAQVRLWYANGNKFPGQKHAENFANGGPVMAKGYMGKSCSYAEGGPVIGKVSNFMKIPDEFRNPDEGHAVADEDQMYSKSGEGSGSGIVKPPKAAGKSLKAVKPKT